MLYIVFFQYSPTPSLRESGRHGAVHKDSLFILSLGSAGRGENESYRIISARVRTKDYRKTLLRVPRPSRPRLQPQVRTKATGKFYCENKAHAKQGENAV